MAKKSSYNFMTCLSGTCKYNVWSKKGKKKWNLNFFFSKSPFCKAATPSMVFEIWNSKVPKMLSHIKSLVCKRIKHTSGVSKDRQSHQCRPGFYLPSKIWFISCKVRFNSWIREYLAGTRSFCVRSALARLRFSSICTGSLHCVSSERGEPTSQR